MSIITCYGQALLPSIICLGRFHIACRYIFTLWQLCQGVNSLVQWLEHWIFICTDQVRFPWEAGNFFSYALFLCYGFHVVRYINFFIFVRAVNNLSVMSWLSACDRWQNPINNIFSSYKMHCMVLSRGCFQRVSTTYVFMFICLCWGFTAQSTQWGHVEHGQFT